MSIKGFYLCKCHKLRDTFPTSSSLQCVYNSLFQGFSSVWLFAWLNHTKFLSAEVLLKRRNKYNLAYKYSLLHKDNSFFLFAHYLQGNGPLAEIYLWREKKATLSALTEQIKHPDVQKVLEILQEAEPGFTEDLQMVLSDLRRHHMQAQDIAKFLSTLERHLKVAVLEKT